MSLNSGRLGSLSIENTSDKALTLKLDINPKTERGTLPEKIKISAQDKYKSDN